jgi:hypothetical protein
LVLGLILLATHVSAISILLLYGGRIFTDFEDVISAALILIPVTASYVTAFLKDTLRNQFVVSAPKDGFVTVSAFIVQLIFLVLFGSSLLYVVLAYVFVGGWTVNQFKILLGVIESAFGIYVGIIVTANYSVEG